jgi:integrase
MGISRKCVRTWLGRYAAEGEAGLRDRSSRPHHSQRRISAALEQRILALRDEQRRGPDWIGAELAVPARTVSRVERVCWTAREAAVFFEYCVDVADPLAELYEVIMGTGMRRAEALALHWTDVRLDDRVLFVRYTLSTVDMSRPAFSASKTRSSYAWIALSGRVVAALLRQRDRQHLQRLTAGGAYKDRDAVRVGTVIARSSGGVAVQANGEHLRVDLCV